MKKRVAEKLLEISRRDKRNLWEAVEMRLDSDLDAQLEMAGQPIKCEACGEDATRYARVGVAWIVFDDGKGPVCLGPFRLCALCIEDAKRESIQEAAEGLIPYVEYVVYVHNDGKPLPRSVYANVGFLVKKPT